MSSEYPAQATVHKLIGDGKWPATKGEILHVNSLEQWQIKLIEMYNQEEIIKQQRKSNALLERIATALEGNVLECTEDDKPSRLEGMISAVTGTIKDFSDDGQLNNSVSEE
jgi:hypothetical protein